MLPGVTVTAISPALQVPQVTAVTNELGEYRLAPLPIGTYEVAFEIGGFQPIRRQNIQLTVGFTARLDVQLGLSTVTESVTVSGAAPVVDVSSTSGSTLLTQDILELSATTRNSVMSVLTMAPGVRSFTDVGGGQMMLENPASRAYGVGGSQWYTVDGVQNDRLGTTFWDYNAFDEVRVQSVGADAERATRGVQVTAVVKSGGTTSTGAASMPRRTAASRATTSIRSWKTPALRQATPSTRSTTSAGKSAAASSATSCGSSARRASAGRRMTC